ncbi:hypothetical protein M433DRAFT_154457 [Acidomyces richmondensis BFW]|nr:MAG: hypothetical protein FE78DRAFT_90550 [Acidomyces sp. 'richmondensis']KYG45508.1 hypothetical protein M433DRAFT_154457 [Acidomyces richmondensis BFW]
MARNQPTYDFLRGGDASPPPLPSARESFKHSIPPPSNTTSKPDIHNEPLRAQLNTLQYELESLKQERELATLQQQQDLRDANSRADAEFQRAQAATVAAEAAKKRADALQRDWQEMQDRATNEKMQLEKKVRGLQDDNRSLREDLEDARAELAGAEREHMHAMEEMEQQQASLRGTLKQLQEELAGKAGLLRTTQQKLGEAEAEVGRLENEVLRLKAQTGDVETLGVIRKELAEQVGYIKKLEAKNGELLGEVKGYRRERKSIEVVEEEKRTLEARLRMMDDLRRELAEAQLQRRILEDEKRGWTEYLHVEAGAEQDMNYETPEQMARAFLQERLERLALVDKLGAIQPEMSVKEENIQALEAEKAKLQAEVERLRGSSSGAGVTVTNAPTGGDSSNKVLQRVQRQKALMLKEVEYLRAQMKTFEAEEAEFNPEHVDEAQRKRIHELEGLVEQYRAELQGVHDELSRLEVSQTPLPSSPKKRARAEDEEENDERLGELRRKTRALQDERDALRTRTKVLAAELQASRSQLSTLQETARTRILELRDNPTAEAEGIKLATLRTLREENAALLQQLETGTPACKVVPISTLNATRQRLEELGATIAQHEKKTLRLKQIWSAKALEFREAVCSILGWRLDFEPNGRVRATSMLYPTHVNAEGEEEENSIVFDGEAGTMKVSGGPRSVFAGEIKGLIEFWVEGRKEIPCFLAACTLEFYERSTRAARA